ncbi:thaumatin family protein, partial [Nonomuraea sp. NPDC050643]|uniref:thaumatin family protein n=1 Tax=Nonomuraea sp. NPDC050643 TaxID=3155660 RepID=UPI0033F3B6CE
AAGAAGAAGAGADRAVGAAASYTVTFVNHSGQTIWIGSGVNADGSENLTGLPTLAPGQSATVAVPMTSTDHWRGKFFARQFCSGAPGSDFRCLVGDCGVQADRCTTGEQPAGLAEFNFDRADRLAPWYNVSYVNAFSLPITISPDNAPPPPVGGGECEVVGCSTALLAYCPAENLTYRPGTRERMVCTNPNRDAATSYSNAITAHCPKAYAWSKQDTVPGNRVMRQCAPCTGFTITFYPPGGTEQAMPRGEIPGFAAKCADVAGADPADRTQVQLYRCNGSIAQQWTVATDGTLRALGKCLDVDGGGTGNGTRVQLYTCNNSGAQQWRHTGGRDIVNPQANKCLDVKDVNSADGTPLHLWECTGGANQKWSLPT